MRPKNKYRHIIQYTLITSTLLIQVALLIFFYNEYFNAKKLDAIEQQLRESAVLRNLMADSRKDLLYAQVNLQQYTVDNKKHSLKNYFNALRSLSDHLDQISAYEKVHPNLKRFIQAKRNELSDIPNLKILINSTFRKSNIPLPKEPDFRFSEFRLEKQPELPKIDVNHISDSVVKKGLLSRLKDAVKGNVNVKHETTVITIDRNSTLDTSMIRNTLDSTLSEMNRHYTHEVKAYQTAIKNAKAKNNNLFEIYGNLVIISNNLTEIYDVAISDFRNNLQQQFDEQRSVNNRVRRASVLGAMILMFLVLVVLMYYTRLSFRYEKELNQANREITGNLKFKNRILGMLSHEIRSPLKIVNLLIDKISRKSKDESIRDYLSSIKFANNSLLIQANQILEYTRNQEKPMELQPSEFNLKENLAALLHVFQPYVESGNNVFVVKNEVSPEYNVFADGVRINQLLTNLLGDATKFTEDGKIEVSALAEEKDAEHLTLKMTVADTGAGIPEADLKNIFKAYYQSGNSGKSDNPGVGLGLNLCKEIIDLFHGQISVSSEVGKGTKVSFALPLQKVSDGTGK